jgi:hypothetical protein
MYNRNVGWLLACLFLILTFRAGAQTDTLKENRLDTLLHKQKGLLGKLAQTLLSDSVEPKKDIQRADIPFQRFRNKVIRSIEVDGLEFGSSYENDEQVNSFFTRTANGLHTVTKEKIVRNHLFFRENDRLSPYLMGNNERYLRDLPFLQEATIIVRNVKGKPDSVDVIVVTKDVLSIGGSASINSSGSRFELREDNIMGWGDKLAFQTLYDRNRSQNFGFGMEYLKRNVVGTFVDASVGYLNFNPSFSSRRNEEKVLFFRLVKPLVNPFVRFTYAFNAELHSTANMFNSDSVYYNSFHYKYRTYDAWANWNVSNFDPVNPKELDRLRFLIGARVFTRRFLDKPAAYHDEYNYSFANTKAFLTSFTVFKLNFYKTSFIYGFGRKEDLPEGFEASLTTGLVKKEDKTRQYLGLAFERYHLAAGNRYFTYTARLAGSVRQSTMEDITLMANVDYFSPLKNWTKKWKQRTFLSASIGKQFHTVLDEPFFLESSYGLSTYNNQNWGGDFRATVKGESVFFSPWNVLYFRFAPFVFSSATVFRHLPVNGGGVSIFPALGGGMRTRNESLVFGTIELRGTYLPKKDAYNNSYVIELNTNIRFKYNHSSVKRPEFILVN